MDVSFLAVLIVSVIVLLILYFISVYNRLIKQRNMCDEGWSGITVQLKRRSDLIPNIVSSVKGYASHEKDTLEKVVAMRNAAMSATAPQEKIAAENALTQSLKSLFALAEAYPDLKANQNFLQLQNTLSEIENDIQNARRYYNATVRDFNTTIGSFPSNLIASKYNFTKKDFFDVPESEQAVPTVTF